MIDLDLSLPVNQVRVMIGDINIEYISDANIEFVLTKNDGNILTSSQECLNYIINDVAYSAREEVGDVQVYWNQVYEQLLQRLEDLKKDSIYANTTQLFYFGNTVKSDIINNRRSSEYVNPTNTDFLNILEGFHIDPNNPYLGYRL